jgi:hypothetical protein
MKNPMGKVTQKERNRAAEWGLIALLPNSHSFPLKRYSKLSE